MTPGLISCQYAAVVDPKLIFQVALKAHASAIAIAHNYPSGNIKPSTEDVRIIHKIKEGAKLLEIKLLYPEMVSDDEVYYSFADEDTHN